MNTFTCNINEPFYSFIIEGDKSVEGRLRKGKWSEMKVGDVLQISKVRLDGTISEFIVTEIILAKTFRELHVLTGNDLLPKFKGDAWNDVYSKIFTSEDEDKYGVVGMRIARIDYT